MLVHQRVPGKYVFFTKSRSFHSSSGKKILNEARSQHINNDQYIDLLNFFKVRKRGTKAAVTAKAKASNDRCQSPAPRHWCMPRPEPDRLTDDWLVELGSSMIDPDVFSYVKLNVWSMFGSPQTSQFQDLKMKRYEKYVEAAAKWRTNDEDDEGWTSQSQISSAQKRMKAK